MFLTADPTAACEDLAAGGRRRAAGLNKGKLKSGDLFC